MLASDSTSEQSPMKLSTRRQNTKPAFEFDRELLPSPAAYLGSLGIKLAGTGEWKTALCPFHKDSRPSLRVQLDSGAFRCMACGAHGGDVLAFHMQKRGLKFIDAAKDLGAWKRNT